MNYQDINEFSYAPKPKNTYTLTQAIFAIVALLLGGLYYKCFFEGDFTGTGRIAPFLFALVFCAYVLIFFKLHSKKLQRETVFFASLTALYSLRIAFYGADGTIGFVCLPVIHLCAMLTVLSASRKICDKIIDSAFMATIKYPFASFASLFASFSALIKKTDKTSDNPRSLNETGMVFIGLVISLPVAIIVITLLMTDSFFAVLAGNIADFLVNISIWDYINPVSVIVAMYIFGAVYTSGTDKTVSDTSESFVSLTVTNTVMITVGIVYVLFVVSQIEGYVCMICGNLPDGVTYSGFARSGFFEICTVACINGVLLYAANARGSGGAVKLSQFMSKAIIIMTLLMIATAAVKLGMYVSAYGFTPKRFYAAWFMILLTVLFALSLTKLFRANFKLSELSVYITAAMLFVLFFVDFEALSAMLNTLFGFDSYEALMHLCHICI